MMSMETYATGRDGRMSMTPTRAERKKACRETTLSVMSMGTYATRRDGRMSVMPTRAEREKACRMTTDDDGRMSVMSLRHTQRACRKMKNA